MTKSILLKSSFFFILGFSLFSLPGNAQDAAPPHVDSPVAQADEAVDDVPRRLDRITVRGARGAPAPQTGRIIFNVNVTPKGSYRRIFSSHRAKRARRSASALISARYGLTFARVNFDENGAAMVAPQSDQDRFYRMTAQPTQRESFAMDLPEGYYALSEIRYDVSEFGRGGVGITPVKAIRPARYCISDKTFIFEVVNGQTSYLGSVLLEEPGSNSAKWNALIPIKGFVQDLQALKKNTNGMNALIAES